MKILSSIHRFTPRLPHYLFAAVVVLRLIALARLSASPLFLPARGDMRFYDDWAQRILRGDFHTHGAFYGLPLYAYLLAFLYKVVGYSPFVVAVIQVLLDAGTAILIYQLCLLVFAANRNQDSKISNKAKIFGALAALGWACYVPAQAYSIVLMPTAWFVFVFWFVVWRLVKNEQGPSRKECLFLGLLVGVAAMAIATILFLVPLIVAALLLKPKHPAKRNVVLGSACLCLGLVLGTSPCWVHNYVVERDPVFLSAHSGVNFWIGNNPTANGYPRFPPGLRAGQVAMLEDSITAAESAAGRSLKRAEVSAYWSDQARNYIREHFGEWLRLLVLKLRNFWSAFQYDDLSIITNLREQGIITAGFYFGIVAALAIPGMFLAWRTAPASRWITAAIALQMLALLTVFVTERYRLPAVPGLLVLAVFGVSVLWQSLVNGNYRESVAYIAILIGSTAIVSWPQRSPSLWALDAYNSGWQALESGNLAYAEKKLLLAKKYVPTNPETSFALGNVRLAQGDKPAAADFYFAALRYDSSHRGALNNLGVMALDANRYDFAETCLRQAESIDPRNAKTHFLLAKALWGKGKRAAAREEIETAIRLRPGQNEFTQLRQQIENGTN